MRLVLHVCGCSETSHEVTWDHMGGEQGKPALIFGDTVYLRPTWNVGIEFALSVMETSGTSVLLAAPPRFWQLYPQWEKERGPGRKPTFHVHFTGDRTLFRFANRALMDTTHGQIRWHFLKDALLRYKHPEVRLPAFAVHVFHVATRLCLTCSHATIRLCNTGPCDHPPLRHMFSTCSPTNALHVPIRPPTCAVQAFHVTTRLCVTSSTTTRLCVTCSYTATRMCVTCLHTATGLCGTCFHLITRLCGGFQYYSPALPLQGRVFTCA